MTGPATVLLGPVIAVMALVFAVVTVLGPSPSSAAALAACSPMVPASSDSFHLDTDQWRSADVIVRVGEQLKVPVRGWVVAIAAALQESGLRPLPYGDADSIGLFQQRTSWGTFAQRMDPTSSATMFYAGGHAGQRGLLDVPNWESMSVTEAAQAVQVSAYPDAYAKWEPVAESVVKKVSGQSATCVSSGEWITPIKPGSFALTAGFGECGSLWESCHTGLDFSAAQGAPAMAASDGVVVFSGVDGPYGNVVHVLHAGGIATWYAHLEQRLVQVGDQVHAGDVVGLVGETGNAYGYHLHFEVRTGATATESGTAIDPKTWLQKHGALP